MVDENPTCSVSHSRDARVYDHTTTAMHKLSTPLHTHASRSVNMVRHPRGSYIVIPIAVSGVATPENTAQLIGAVIHKQESRHKVPKSVLQAVLERMQFTLHATRRTPYGASRLVQAMPAWLAKTRRAPFRHSRDARLYGHTTTAMHKLSAPPHIHTSSINIYI